MNWNECKNNFIKEVEIDIARRDSIIEKALIRLKRARETKINEENVSLVIEDYYEVIKELLTAYLLNNGFRSKNHQCLISYFYKENPNFEKEAYLIAQMSFFRNRLNYYGESIPLDFYRKHKNDFENIIKIVEGLIKNKKRN